MRTHSRNHRAKVFDFSQQLRFANASGDFNPIHVDELVARRSKFGTCVVHGMHTLLWALNEVAEADMLIGPFAIKARFSQFVSVGDAVSLYLPEAGGGSLQLVLIVQNTPVAHLLIVPKVSNDGEAVPLSANWMARRSNPRELSHVDLASARGWFNAASSDALSEMFPALIKAVGSQKVAALANVSYLVGMICPGLHSILSGLNVQFSKPAEKVNGLTYATRRFSEATRLLQMNIVGDGIVGDVAAQYRQMPISQQPIEGIQKYVCPAEFNNQSALVIGGSRGLGALTAKIIAAGGGTVWLTYATGLDDAAAVVEEINRFSERKACEAFPLDILNIDREQLVKLSPDVRQMYFYATPRIYRPRRGSFSFDLFEEFCAYYVNGFAELWKFLISENPKMVTFYPSSVFLTEKPKEFGEYISAKILGETVCGEFNKTCDFGKILVRRLPRLLTDQTADVAGLTPEPSASILSTIVREMSNGFDNSP